MKRLASLMILIALAGPAQAHALKLFATVEGDAVTGYAFFIGGGRAQDTDWVAKDAQGAELASGRTDAEGGYRFVAPAPVTGPLTVIVDTHEGHVAIAEIGPERFGAPPVAATGAPAAASLAARGVASAMPAQDISPLVEAAVQRQVAPLLARIEEMDARIRITDLLSGLFLIIGLGGIGLYIRGRRR